MGLTILFVSLSSSVPELTSYRVEGTSMSIPREEDAAKAWYGQLVFLENQFTDHVCLSLSSQIL